MELSIIQLVMIIPLALVFCITLGSKEKNGVTDPAADTQSDVDAIKDVLNNYKQTVEAKDFDAWLALWDENGVRMPPDEPAAIGIKQIRAQMEVNFTPGIGTVLTIDQKDIQVTGDWGYVRSDGSILLTFPDGNTTTLFANVLTIFKKQADNSWKIYIDCFNFHKS
jgi:uncharacterized protein (TIGR02246 family)